MWLADNACRRRHSKRVAVEVPHLDTVFWRVWGAVERSFARLGARRSAACQPERAVCQPGRVVRQPERAGQRARILVPLPGRAHNVRRLLASSAYASALSALLGGARRRSARPQRNNARHCCSFYYLPCYLHKNTYDKLQLLYIRHG